MKILIITTVIDAHADAVRWGLLSLGHAPIMWYWENFPRSDTSTLKISQNNLPTLELILDGISYSAPFDVIWVRRKGEPTSMEGSHSEDIKIIQNESNKYIDGIIPFLGNKKTLWINDFESDRKSNKTTQLIAAAELGFRIPDTLIGNDCEQVRSFFRKHNGKIIFKAFSPGYWENEDGSATVLRTSAIEKEHISNDFAIRACPAIYQELVEKKYELRVTVIGSSVIAAAIYSQDQGSTVDWRFEGGEGISNLKSIALSSAISEKCLALCKKLGLIFGCIDLIVDKNDEIIFLEVNNIGQFLWKENSDPSLTMLDTFCRFLVSADNEPNPLKSDRLTMLNYFESEMYRCFNEKRSRNIS